MIPKIKKYQEDRGYSKVKPNSQKTQIWAQNMDNLRNSVSQNNLMGQAQSQNQNQNQPVGPESEKLLK